MLEAWPLDIINTVENQNIQRWMNVSKATRLMSSRCLKSTRHWIDGLRRRCFRRVKKLRRRQAQANLTWQTRQNYRLRRRCCSWSVPWNAAANFHSKIGLSLRAIWSKSVARWQLLVPLDVQDQISIVIQIFWRPTSIAIKESQSWTKK